MTFESNTSAPLELGALLNQTSSKAKSTESKSSKNLDNSQTASNSKEHEMKSTALSRKESRKISHSVIEKRRREKINTCLSKLRTLVPGCKEFGDSIQKLTILELTVDYILALQEGKVEASDQIPQAHNLIDQIENVAPIYPLSPSPSHSACLDSNAGSPKKMSISSILNK